MRNGVRELVAPWAAWTGNLWDSARNVSIQKAGQNFLLISTFLLAQHDILLINAIQLWLRALDS